MQRLLIWVRWFRWLDRTRNVWKIICVCKGFQCDAVDCGRMLIIQMEEKLFIRKRKTVLISLKIDCRRWGSLDQRFYTSRIWRWTGNLYFSKTVNYRNEIKFPEHLKYEDNYWSAVIRLYISSFYHIADNCYHYRQRKILQYTKKIWLIIWIRWK